MAGEVKSDWVTDDVYAAGDANDVANAINRSLGAAAAYVATGEDTASTTFADLTTTTDQVTVTIGPSGKALVAIYASQSNSTTAYTQTGVDVSGATTIAADDTRTLVFYSPAAGVQTKTGVTHLFTGLNAGSTTFKMKYKVNGGTGTWTYRRIVVIPL